MNRLIAITGKMASGKTTLAKKIIASHPEFIYVDVDIFRRNLYKNKEYLKDLKKELPVLKKYPEINSLILNQYIYQDEELMLKYKKILYKYLFNYLNTFPNKTILVEWALIINDHLTNYFSKIIYLDTDINIILERLKASDLSKEEILKRLKMQEIKKEELLSNQILILKDVIDMSRVDDFIKKMECKFTLPNDGGKAIWEITHNCNYGCSYCLFSCQKTNSINDELTTEECYHVIDELVKNGFKYLKVTGGEPFLRKDIIDILKYASKRMITDVSTNASLITKEKLKALNELNLKMIHVSVDGNKKEHESVRGKGTYEATMRGLKILEESKNRIRIGTVIHLNNENNLESLINDCLNIKASEVIFSIMEPVSGQDKSKYRTRSIKDLEKEILTLKEKYQDKIIVNYNFGESPNYVTICPAGKKLLHINNYGYVSPCEWVLENDKTCISKQSLKDHSLEEILNEDHLKKFTCHKKEGICYGKI